MLYMPRAQFKSQFSTNFHISTNYTQQFMYNSSQNTALSPPI